MTLLYFCLSGTSHKTEVRRRMGTNGTFRFGVRFCSEPLSANILKAVHPELIAPKRNNQGSICWFVFFLHRQQIAITCVPLVPAPSPTTLEPCPHTRAEVSTPTYSYCKRSHLLFKWHYVDPFWLQIFPKSISRWG